MKKTKCSIACKDVGPYNINQILTQNHTPVSGDVALFEVLETGKHKMIQSENKQNIHIFPGDLILGAFGNRYATEQFEGYLPAEVRTEFHILGMGGVIGVLKSSHSSMPKPSTLRIVGYATNENGEIINTKQLNKNFKQNSNTSEIKIILSIGSSMDSGKTTTAGFLARGLKNSGNKVGYIKLTGTAFTKDKDFVFDCGADITLDFSDEGFPSTYMCSENELLSLHNRLMSRIAMSDPDFVIIEIADGLLQRETNLLLKNKKFMDQVDAVVFSTVDSLSAIHGIKLLADAGIRPFALSGIFTMSPLLIKEVIDNCSISVLTTNELMSEEVISLISHYKVKEKCFQ